MTAKQNASAAATAEAWNRSEQGEPNMEKHSTALVNIKSADIGGFTVQAVDARELHACLGVGKDFTTWIKDRIESYGFVQGQDFEVFPGIGENLKGGRPSSVYSLTLDMAKELAMVERNDKGREVRRYFIACERKAMEPLPRGRVIVNREDVRRLQSHFAELSQLRDSMARLLIRTQHALGDCGGPLANLHQAAEFGALDPSHLSGEVFRVLSRAGEKGVQWSQLKKRSRVLKGANGKVNDVISDMIERGEIARLVAGPRVTLYAPTFAPRLESPAH